VGRRVGVVDVGAELGRERLDQVAPGVLLGRFLGEFVIGHPDVLEEEYLAVAETVDR